jgi:ribulose-phosphate 3-epimerase
MKPIIAPSVLSADFANLQRDVTMINESQADWFHVDIMDGVFVPNISFGLPVCAAIKKYAAKPLDVHLMIVQPEKYIEAFKEAGAANITVHAEACVHLHRVIQQIHATGCKAGVAINPHTPVNVLENVLNDIDLVCLMSVNPGFGGQQFITRTFDKIKQLNLMREEAKANFLIEIDGGVSDKNARQLLELGADVLVAGNFVFNSKDPKATIESLKAIG